MAVIIDFASYKAKGKATKKEPAKSPWDDFVEWELSYTPPIQLPKPPPTQEERLANMVERGQYYDLYVKYVSLQRFEEMIGNEAPIKIYKDWLAELVGFKK